MKQTKFFETIIMLEKSELEGFVGFLESLLSTKHPCYLLVKYLTACFPNFPENKIERKFVYKKIYNDSFNDNKFNKLLTETFKKFEQYVIEVLSPIEDVLQRIKLLQFYYQRNLNRNYESLYKEVLTKITHLKESSFKNYLFYCLEDIHVDYLLKKNNRNANYQQLYNHLDAFYLIEKLRIENLSMINLVPQLESNEPVGDLYLIHKNLNEFLKHQDDEKFLKLLDLAGNFLQYLEKSAIKEILLILLDYAIKAVNSGKLDFYYKCLEIFNLQEKFDVLLDNETTMPVSTYKNYITVALKIKQTAVAESFLIKYKDKLLPEFMEETYIFNKANIEFEKGNHDFVLETLNLYRFNDIFYKLNSKRLIIKALYECCEHDDTYFDALYNNLNAFKKFVYTEDSIPEIYIEANKNFFKITTQLEKVLYNKEKLKKLKEKIVSTPKLAEREWLLSKL